MPRRLIILWPLLGAFLLLVAGYWAMSPATPVRAAAALAPLSATSAATILVDRLDDPVPPTGSQCTAAANDCSLRSAIAAAANGDTVEIVVAGTINLQQGSIGLSKDVTITSASAATHIIDAPNANNIFGIGGGLTVKLVGLTLQGGNTTGNGGAISMETGTLTMTNVILQNNVAQGVGGALSILPNGNGTANVYITNAEFLNNHAVDDFLSGGAIHAFAISGSIINLLIDDSRFEGNVGGDETTKDGYGGAISASTLRSGPRVTVEIRNSEFINNTSGNGGAIYYNTYTQGNGGPNSLDSLIYDSEFVGNSGKDGGAILIGALDKQVQTTVIISNTAFLSNSADTRGGAFTVDAFNRDTSDTTATMVKVYNSTFAANRSASGGAIYQYASSSNAGAAGQTNLDLVNSTFSRNQADDGGAIYAGAGNSAATSSYLTATHVTFFENALAEGQDIFAFKNSASTLSVFLKNSIIGGSAGATCNLNGVTIAGLNNLIKDTSCGVGAPFRLGNAVGLDHDLADNGGPTLTHALYTGSNALNAVPAGQCNQGNGGAAVTRDQRGQARPFGAACDIGAFEAQTANPPASPAITGVTANSSSPTVPGNPTFFTATVSGGPVDFYTWDFGDGNTGSGITTTHTYAEGGVFTAIVTATNAAGTQSDNTEVTVGAPIAGLEATNDGPKVVDSAVLFNATVDSGQVDSFTWNFGDGENGSGPSPSHSYSTAGVYTATVVASNSINTLTTTTTVYVGDTIVEVESNSFAPPEVTVAPGAKVVWVLLGGFHSVTADDDSFEQPAGSDWPPFVNTFVSAGTFSYYCNIHGAKGGIGMSGKVIVSGPPDGVRLPSIIRQADEE